jgi:hypothetical protein
MQIDFSPLREQVNSMAIQLGIFLAITLGGGIIVFLLLRAIKIPKKVALVLANISMLVVGYYTVINLFG